MYRLLIVDDEAVITNGLYEIFNQLRLPDLDICKAYSGQEALNWLRRTRIDIVLSDIRMPGISGLKLMTMIQEHWPRCKTIFLSGFNEFDYVYQAIQSPGVSYLLKSEGHPKVIETVKKVISELDESKRVSGLLENSEQQERMLVTMTYSDYFSRLLGGGIEQEHLQSDFSSLHLRLSAELPILLVLGRISQGPASYVARREQLLSVLELADNFLEQQVFTAGSLDQQGGLQWLIQPNIANNVDGHNTTEEYYAQTVRFLLGTLELLQDACQASLGLTISLIVTDEPTSWHSVGQSYIQLSGLMQLRLHDGAPMVLTDKMAGLVSMQRKEGVMGQIKSFVRGHLAEELSLVRLAEIAHFNPSYLSRLFKQECGINLSDYIDEVRIGRAKELLEYDNEKIYEIGRAVGYETPHSFTRFFKKMTGMSPQEYRESSLNK
ncbi:response regulator transcription factor [Paenibacillus harenae]|uniref:YesN/AraC family two-component response regulator n=1 Tax=Paenibacillus harenae TaxID=306543 RepID=A0ABT9U4W6_PAEHA|nr:helix-turn-helix domain-containing protein [Paenibacillus harenae]MDQ0113710.1 YesN/AraC family two-component response regulator [Paenibacillus harenae]